MLRVVEILVALTGIIASVFAVAMAAVAGLGFPLAILGAFFGALLATACVSWLGGLHMAFAVFYNSDSEPAVTTFAHEPVRYSWDRPTVQFPLAASIAAQDLPENRRQRKATLPGGLAKSRARARSSVRESRARIVQAAAHANRRAERSRRAEAKPWDSGIDAGWFDGDSDTVVTLLSSPAEAPTRAQPVTAARSVVTPIGGPILLAPDAVDSSTLVTPLSDAPEAAPIDPHSAPTVEQDTSGVFLDDSGVYGPETGTPSVFRTEPGPEDERAPAWHAWDGDASTDRGWAGRSLEDELTSGFAGYDLPEPSFDEPSVDSLGGMVSFDGPVRGFEVGGRAPQNARLARSQRSLESGEEQDEFPFPGITSAIDEDAPQRRWHIRFG